MVDVEELGDPKVLCVRAQAPSDDGTSKLRGYFAPPRSGYLLPLFKVRPGTAVVQTGSRQRARYRRLPKLLAGSFSNVLFKICCVALVVAI